MAKQEKKAAEKEAKMAVKNPSLLRSGHGSAFAPADTASSTISSPYLAQNSSSHTSLPSYQEDHAASGYSCSDAIRSDSPHTPLTTSPRFELDSSAAYGARDSRKLQELQQKAQQVNLDCDRRKLKKDNQKPSKQQRLEEERTDKLAELQKKIEKERRKIEKSQEKSAEGLDALDEKAGLEVTQACDWYGDEERRRAALGPSVSDKDLAKTLEKERKLAAKLRWIVVQNLPDHGAFPDEGPVLEERRRFW